MVVRSRAPATHESAIVLIPPPEVWEPIRKWLASTARKYERGEITAAQLEAIGKHASRLGS